MPDIVNVVALIDTALPLILIGEEVSPLPLDSWSAKEFVAENEPVVVNVTETGDPGQGTAGDIALIVMVCDQDKLLVAKLITMASHAAR